MTELASFLGTSTMILATLMVVIAVPSQIIKNYQNKHCGFSLPMVILPLLVYISRAGYSLAIKSYFIFIPDAIGLIFLLIILWQYIKYKKPS